MSDCCFVFVLIIYFLFVCLLVVVLYSLGGNVEEDTNCLLQSMV